MVMLLFGVKVRSVLFWFFRFTGLICLRILLVLLMILILLLFVLEINRVFLLFNIILIGWIKFFFFFFRDFNFYIGFMWSEILIMYGFFLMGLLKILIKILIFFVFGGIYCILYDLLFEFRILDFISSFFSVRIFVYIGLELVVLGLLW